MFVKVKATDDSRVVRVSPEGEFIPSDRFVDVALTPYILRLINVHGDLILKTEEKENPTPKAPPSTKGVK